MAGLSRPFEAGETLSQLGSRTGRDCTDDAHDASDARFSIGLLAAGAPSARMKRWAWKCKDMADQIIL